MRLSLLGAKLLRIREGTRTAAYRDATGTLTTTLPTNTTLLLPSCWMSVGGTSSVIGVSLIGMYLEQGGP